jgi:glutathione-specific gamma-glutamylcyclotransferase
MPGRRLQAASGQSVRAAGQADPARDHGELPNNIPRSISVATDQRPVRAIAFVMNRQSRFYVGKLPPAPVADVLAKGCGHWGSGAEYLHNTVAHLEEHGIRDRNLWRLQALGADPNNLDPTTPAEGTASQVS